MDPSPDGHCLPDTAIGKAAEDCAAFADFTFLEPMGVAFIASKDEPILLRRHRLVLILRQQRLSETLGHVQAYCNLVLPGHPVMISLRPTGFIA
jgi:hypothetical protein